MKPIRILTALLTAALMLSALAACGEAAGAPAAETASPGTPADVSVTAAVTEPETAAPTDNLPETDLGGLDFTILTRSEFRYEFGIDAQTGDVIDDAVFTRNADTAERFNVNLQVADVAGSWSAQDTFKKAVHASILAGDGAYDLVAGAGNYVMAMTSEGGFLDLTTVRYLDLTADWWSQGFVNNMKVGGALYMAAGDVALTSLENMCVVLFNKQLIGDYSLEDPYAMVSGGSWTLDAMTAMARQVSEDLNGDGKIDVNDRYGLMTYNNMIRAMIQSFGIPYTGRGADGYPEITFMSDRLITACDAVTAFMKEDCALNYTSSLNDTLDIAAGMQELFSHAQVLFMTQVISSAEALRTMEVDFGILPYPMLDEAQGRYYTTVLENVTAMGILTSVKDPDASGLILEALAFAGRQSITPAYFEIALKNKFARDNESEAMLDIIRESTWYDFGYINSMSLEGINALFASCVLNDTPIASAFESMKPKCDAALAKLLDAYKELG